jgi:hypothetical protein
MKKGTKYYHIGYLVQDFEKAVAELVNLDYKPFPEFISEAFNFKRCQFMFAPDGSLIELIEQ